MKEGFLKKYMQSKGIKEEEEKPEVEMGEKEEKEEHDVSDEKAEEIASDHVEEDENYYEKMKFMKDHPKALEHFMAAVKCASK